MLFHPIHSLGCSHALLSRHTATLFIHSVKNSWLLCPLQSVPQPGLGFACSGNSLTVVVYQRALEAPLTPPAASSHSLPRETLAFSRHVDRHFLSWICFSLWLKHVSLTFHNFSSSLKAPYKCPMCVKASWKPRKSFLSILLYVSVHKACSKFPCTCLHFPPRWELLQFRVCVLFIFSSSYVNVSTHHWVGPQWRLLDDSWKSVGPKWKRNGLRQGGWLSCGEIAISIGVTYVSERGKGVWLSNTWNVANCELRCAASIKYTSDFEDLVWKMWNMS